MAYRRYVLAHHELGVYLGSGPCGAGNVVTFWSRIDPSGCPPAVAFRGRASATLAVLTFDRHGIDHVRAVPVGTASPDFASVAECEAAGLPGWRPEDRRASRRKPYRPWGWRKKKTR